MEEVRAFLNVSDPFWLVWLKNLREEVAMDVDEDEDGTQPVRKVADYDIEVNFDSLDDDEREVLFFSWLQSMVLGWPGRQQDNSPETVAEYDTKITKLNSDIERMAPNMKAVDRWG